MGLADPGARSVGVMAIDVGQHLVAAYHAVVEGADYVHMNTALPTEQGDIDVIALTLPRKAVLCEVKTHLAGLGGYDGKADEKIREQLSRSRQFAESQLIVHGFECSFELWSPKVGPSLATKLEPIAAEVGFTLVINDVYARRVGALATSAHRDERFVDNPAYRTLQILTRLPGILRAERGYSRPGGAGSGG